MFVFEFVCFVLNCVVCSFESGSVWFAVVVLWLNYDVVVLFVV